LFSREVLPHFRNVWDEDGWDNKWWPTALRGKTNAENIGRAPRPEMHASK